MGKREQHASIPYEDKEGYQWESASRAMSPRLKEQMSKVISVCDREADIYEYLQYKLTEQQRLAVRSMQSRYIGEGEDKRYAFAQALTSAGTKPIDIAQKGGRKARTATRDITFAPVTLKVPYNKKDNHCQYTMWVVRSEGIQLVIKRQLIAPFLLHLISFFSV